MRSAVKLLLYPVRVLLVGLVSCPLVLAQASTSTGRAGPTIVGKIIAEAKAAESPNANYRYAQQLTEMLVPVQAGNAYSETFSSRLSRADLMARHNERAWIPESMVAKAFNDLMRNIGGRSGDLPHTDTNVVHQLRITFSEVSPALSTVNFHESECLPSEAVHLLVQLVSHNGSTEGPCPPKPEPNGALVQHACTDVDASILMSKFSRSHSAPEIRTVFDRAAQLFGI